MGGGIRPKKELVSCPYCGQKDIDKTHGLSVHMNKHKREAKKEQRTLGMEVLRRK